LPPTRIGLASKEDRRTSQSKRKEHTVSEHAEGKPDQTGKETEDQAPDRDASGQEHHNPETDEDTASGGAPDK
jgi:hypothetical protein